MENTFLFPFLPPPLHLHVSTVPPPLLYANQSPSLPSVCLSVSLSVSLSLSLCLCLSLPFTPPTPTPPSLSCTLVPASTSLPNLQRVNTTPTRPPPPAPHLITTTGVTCPFPLPLVTAWTLPPATSRWKASIQLQLCIKFDGKMMWVTSTWRNSLVWMKVVMVMVLGVMVRNHRL